MDNRGTSISTLQTFAQVQQVQSLTLDFFESLIHSIEHNGHLIVVHTKPGKAMTVAKFIDDKKFDQVMDTVAGDDTIMIAFPLLSIKKRKKKKKRHNITNLAP